MEKKIWRQAGDYAAKTEGLQRRERNSDGASVRQQGDSGGALVLPPRRVRGTGCVRVHARVTKRVCARVPAHLPSLGVGPAEAGFGVGGRGEGPAPEHSFCFSSCGGDGNAPPSPGSSGSAAGPATNASPLGTFNP